MSPLGNNSNNGEKETPFKTIEKALESVKLIKKKENDKINIRLLEGEYHLNSTLEIKPYLNNLSIIGDGLNKVSIKGSKVIETKWEQFSDNILVTTIDENLDFICKNLPGLKITLEHITTKDATEYIVDGNKNLAASITPHHLALSRNALFDRGIRPHNFCLPILKRESHRKALVNMAVSGNAKFFLGTDTAPHQKNDKETLLFNANDLALSLM